MWSTPRRHSMEPSIDPLDRTNKIITSGNVDAEHYDSGTLDICSPIQALQSDLKSFNRTISGRPCLAGTQSVGQQQQHQQSNATRSTMSVDNTRDQIHSSILLDNLTHDTSSGFGSLLTDRHSLSSSTFPTQRLDSYRWGANHNNNNQSLLSVDSKISSPLHMGSDPSRHPAPICTQTQSQRVAIDLATLSRNKLTTDSWLISDSVDDGSYNLSGPGSGGNGGGRESRMLEENLASVACYVEELTGCAGPKTHELQAHRIDDVGVEGQRGLDGATREDGVPVSIGRPSSVTSTPPPHQRQQQQQPLPQWLNQQLATALKTHKGVGEEKIVDRAVVPEQTPEQLLRLLTQQFPNNLINTSGSTEKDITRWLSGLLSTKTTTPTSNNDRATSSGDYSTMNQLISPGPSYSGIRNQVSSRNMTTIPNLDFVSDGHMSSTSNFPSNQQQQQQQQQQPSQVDLQTASLIYQLLSSTNPNADNVVNNLIGQGHSPIQGGAGSGVSRQMSHRLNEIGNNNISNQSAAILASLISNSQQSETISSPKVVSQTYRRTPITSTPGHGGMGAMSTCSDNNTNNPNLGDELARLAVPYQQLLISLENEVERAANVYRNSASTVSERSEAAYHWSGRLPVRVYRAMTFSRKVFLGGVPWDSTSEDLIMAFSRFGHVTVSWPQQEGAATFRNRTAAPKGYCYLIFDYETSVSELLAACIRDPSNGGDYYKISSSKFKSKDVQVIPWVISDSQYTKSGPHRPDTKRTVFIGALHGMITAEALVTIVNDLFGNVVFAALDTDKYKYPIGSGRVAFSSNKSYMRAVTANFVDIRTSKFVKTIQIDPYLEDSLCNSCQTSPGIYFCRAFECFRYFCPICWQLWHNATEGMITHKPLRRTFKPTNDRQMSNAMKFPY